MLATLLTVSCRREPAPEAPDQESIAVDAAAKDPLEIRITAGNANPFHAPVTATDKEKQEFYWVTSDDTTYVVQFEAVNWKFTPEADTVLTLDGVDVKRVIVRPDVPPRHFRFRDPVSGKPEFPYKLGRSGQPGKDGPAVIGEG